MEGLERACGIKSLHVRWGNVDGGVGEGGRWLLDELRIGNRFKE